MVDSETDNNGIDRAWLLKELTDWYRSGEKRASLIGPPGVGKSWVVQKLAASIPDTLLIDFAEHRERESWPRALSAEELSGRMPKFLILDSLESAAPAIWRTRHLDTLFADVPILFVHRPGVHAEGLQSPKLHVFTLAPGVVEQDDDLQQYLTLQQIEHCQGQITTFAEAEYFRNDHPHPPSRVESYYLSLWREVTRPHSGSLRVLMEQLALLLADVPEPLPWSTITDFTGVPTVQVMEAVDHLSPILWGDPRGICIFSPGMASFLTRHFKRDMGPVHGRIVSFFRETYPSWHEMHDQYGWRYLVLHCDRLARASRRQDYSVLHWLNEGSFSQLKLERTGMLPSVLKDLRLSLLASLETRDLPRIVSFGIRIAKLRKQESVKTVHRLADSGQLTLARENAHLISGEGQKFLVWVLFATQTLENDDLSSTLVLLREALAFPTVDLSQIEVELAASLLGVMFCHPELDADTKTTILGLLRMHDDPAKRCLALKTAARVPLLEKAFRLNLLNESLDSARDIPAKEASIRAESELETRISRLTPSDSTKKKAYPVRLLEAKKLDKAWSKLLGEVRKEKTPVATAAAALVPIEDSKFVSQAFHDLADTIKSAEGTETQQHSLAGILQSLEDSQLKEVPIPLVDAVSESILELESPEDRAHYLARFAVMLSFKGRPIEAQQRISLAAANAFGVGETLGRATSLLRVAQNVALTGAIGRARDLTYHALELWSKVEKLDQESQQLVKLLSSESAGHQTAEEILRLGQSLQFDDTPLELEAKGRAMVTLAAGLSRLGANEQAKIYRKNAADAVRGIAEPALRIHLLCDLAAAFQSSGDKKSGRKLIKEARQLFDEMNVARNLTSMTALLRAYMVFENKTQIRKMFDHCHEFLASPSGESWLASPAFLEFVHQSQVLDQVKKLTPYLEDARKNVDLSDLQRLGILRCELQLGNLDAAETHLRYIHDLSSLCQGGIDLSLACLNQNPDQALSFLGCLPLESARSEGIRRLALLNGSEIRPSEQLRVNHVLCQLTLMAIDHPDAMDSVLTRWIQSSVNRDEILAIADKMGWSTGAGELFSEALKTVQNSPTRLKEETRLAEELREAEEAREAEQESEAEAESAEPQDDGFQVVSLTKSSLPKSE